MNLIIDLIINKGHLVFDSPITAFAYYFVQITGIVFCLLYFHQFIYLIIGTLKHHKIKQKEFRFHSIGIVISARNESSVIGNLIKSIRDNDYPQAMLRIFVVADNCTDNTAQICRDLGCEVFERFNTEQVGKGYALNYLFTKLHTEPEWADKIPEAYIVLDADNIIKPNFITEMNKVYDSGYDMVTSYRNSKNFGQNWITAGYAYWFLHEARHLNNSRMIINSSCAISGTGFLISQAVVKEFGNWSFFSLTEDIQCSTTYAVTGRKVAYCSSAELYDEQPSTFKQSWRQRERWARGYYQVIGMQGKNLIKNTFTKFACWDILTTIIPALISSLLVVTVLPFSMILGLVIGDFVGFLGALKAFGMWAAQMYSLIFLIGLLICITEWKRIKCSNFKKIFYVFTLPFFMMTYIPLSITAMFKKKVEWKPIVHTANVSLDEIEKTKK